MCEDFDGLYILNFKASAIKKSEKIHEEMTRLSCNVLDTSRALCVPDNNLTIAFVNVRSIMGKVVDIKADTNFTNASIIVFCETRLTPSQGPLDLHDGHVELRCARTIDNHHGGVLLSVPLSMNPLM